MPYSCPARRPLMIAGLRDLSDFLKANPDLPIPYSVDLTAFVPRSSDPAMRAEVERVAGLLGTQIDPANVPYGHYDTALNFGPVEYRVCAVLAHARARYAALSSYEGAVTPDAVEEA